MAIYIILALIFFQLSFLKLEKGLNHKGRNRYIFLLLLLPFVLAAFRGIDVGNDTYTYFKMYRNVGNFDKFFNYMRVTRIEPGYSLLMFLFQRLGASYEVFQVFYESVIYLSFKNYIRKYSENYALSCFMFIANRNLAGTMNTVRMWLAIAILLNTVPYIKQRKLVRFLLIVLLASTMHYSAMLFVIVYIMTGFKKEHFVFPITIISAVVIAYIGTPFFKLMTNVVGRYEGYLSTGYFDTSGALAIYINFIISFAFLAYYTILRRYDRGIKHYDENSIIISNQYIFYIMYFITFSFSLIGLKNQIMSRLSSYFSISALALLPYALQSSPNKSNQTIMHLLIGTLLFIEFVIIMIYRPNWQGIIPYHTFFTD